MNGALTQVVIGMLTGLLLGAGYFALLRYSVRRFANAAPAGQVVVLAMLRIALAIGVFWGLAQLGPPALLAGLAGFLVSRLLTQWRLEV